MAETATNIPPPPPSPIPLPRTYLLHLPQPQSPFLPNDAVASAIPVLTTFMQLKYQVATANPNTTSPFSTHPAAIYTAVCGSVLYYSARVALPRSSPARRCSVWAGYVSVASLASVLLPDRFAPFVYAAFAVLSAAEFVRWLWNVVAEFGVGWFLNGVRRAAGGPAARRRLILPL